MTAPNAATSTAPDKTRRFWVRIDVQVEVSERLLADVLTDEWRRDFYPLHTAGDVAGHLAFNLIQGSPLQGLDGFADQPAGHASILSVDVDDDVEEDVPGPKRTAHRREASSRVPGERVLRRRHAPATRGDPRTAKTRGRRGRR